MALVVRNLPANAGDVRDTDLIPGLGWSPGGGHDNPLQYSCLENPMDRGAWQPTVQEIARSRTWLSDWTFCEHPWTHHLNSTVKILLFLLYWLFYSLNGKVLYFISFSFPVHACVLSHSVVSDSCNPMGCSLPASSVQGIFQARILGWGAISSSRGSSWPRDQTHVSCLSCIGRSILYHWATEEAHLYQCIGINIVISIDI